MWKMLLDYISVNQRQLNWRMRIDAQRGINTASHSNDTDEKVF